MTTANPIADKPKKKVTFPSAFTILILLLVLIALATWLVPAGSYGYNEGLIGRVVILVIGTIIGIIFVMRYGEKVKKDPTKSLIYDMKAENEEQFMSGGGEGINFGKFTVRHLLAIRNGSGGLRA